MHTQTCDGEFRISGLQLPEELTSSGGGAACSLSVVQTTTYRWSLAEDLDGYARAGISGIGLYRPKLAELDEELAIDLVRSSGLNVTSLSWIGGFCDECQPQESLFDAGEAIQLAAALGAGTVALVSGTSGSFTANHARRLFIEWVRQACARAADLGVRLALHPAMPSHTRRSPLVATHAEALDIVGEVSRDNLGIVIDIDQLCREPDLLDRATLLATHAHVVRASDRRRAFERRSHASDVAAITHLLESGYVGPLEMDLWSDEGQTVADYEGRLMSCRTRFETFGAPAESPA